MMVYLSTAGLWLALVCGAGAGDVDEFGDGRFQSLAEACRLFGRDQPIAHSLIKNICCFHQQSIYQNGHVRALCLGNFA